MVKRNTRKAQKRKGKRTEKKNEKREQERGRKECHTIGEIRIKHKMKYQEYNRKHIIRMQKGDSIQNLLFAF